MIRLAFALALLAACGRPVAESHCRNSLDCESGDWCVSRLDGQSALPRAMCLPPCASDGECESGVCAAIGDGNGPPVTTVPHVCAP